MKTHTTQVKFEIIGCGHSEALKHHNNNALLSSPNEVMMIDCGHTAKAALADLGYDFSDIDSIFITHVHGDHVFGLERVAYETKFTHNTKVTLYIDKRIEEELWDRTLSGSLGSNSDGVCVLSDWFDVKYIENQKIPTANFHINVFEVQHTPNKLTLGLLINNKIFYSSDTVAIPDIVNSIHFDIAFHDVTLTDWNPVHATLSSLIKEYDVATRKKMFLMSYEDAYHAYEKEVNKEFAGLAFQGQTIVL